MDVPRFLDDALIRLSAKPGDGLLLAFSGGPDSSALAAGLGRLPSRWDLRLCHVDHGLDPASAARAVVARGVAESLGLPFSCRVVPGARPPGESLEAWARRRRYELLEEERRRWVDGLEAGRRVWVVTAHHSDDQAETLLLRLAFGTGWTGLGGIRRRHGWVLRPALDLRRRQLAAFGHGSGLQPVEDPTNEDLRRPRNRIRHRILPEWNKREPDLVALLGRVADRAARSTERLDTRLASLTRLRPAGTGISGLGASELGVELSVPRLRALPAVLRRQALEAAERKAGRALGSSARAKGELLDQLDGKRHAGTGCDAGDGWRWQGDSATLRLLPPATQPSADFTYTLRVPGSIELQEIGARLSIETVRSTGASQLELGPLPNAPSEFRLFVPARACRATPSIEARSRRPGDRIRLPSGSKKVKSLLIDRKIPRERRDQLPIVIFDDHVAWIPGVAFDERYRARHGDTTGWLLRLRRTAGTTEASGSRSVDDGDAIADIHPPAD